MSDKQSTSECAQFQEWGQVVSVNGNTLLKRGSTAVRRHDIDEESSSLESVVGTLCGVHKHDCVTSEFHAKPIGSRLIRYK